MRHVLLIMGILLLAGCETEYFASAPDSVIVVQFRSADPNGTIFMTQGGCPQWVTKKPGSVTPALCVCIFSLFSTNLGRTIRAGNNPLGLSVTSAILEENSDSECLIRITI